MSFKKSFRKLIASFGIVYNGHENSKNVIYFEATLLYKTSQQPPHLCHSKYPHKPPTFEYLGRRARAGTRASAFLYFPFPRSSIYTTLEENDCHKGKKVWHSNFRAGQSLLSCCDSSWGRKRERERISKHETPLAVYTHTYIQTFFTRGSTIRLSPAVKWPPPPPPPRLLSKQLSILRGPTRAREPTLPLLRIFNFIFHSLSFASGASVIGTAAAAAFRARPYKSCLITSKLQRFARHRRQARRCFFFLLRFLFSSGRASDVLSFRATAAALPSDS